MKQEKKLTEEDVLREIRGHSRRAEEIVKSLEALQRIIVQIEEVQKMLDDLHEKGKTVRNQDGSHLSW